RGLMSILLRPFFPDVGMALDIAAAFTIELPDLAFSRLTSMAATAAPDVRLNARSLTGTLPVGAMLLACDFTEITAAVGADNTMPVLPMWGRFDRIVPPRTGHEFAELVGEPVHWVRGAHSWMIPRPATQLNVLRHTEQGRAFCDRVEDRRRLLHRAA